MLFAPPQVAEIVRLAPKKRQTMLFSATFSEQVRDLMALSLKSPVRLAADAAAAAPKGLVQEVVRLKVRDLAVFWGAGVCFGGLECVLGGWSVFWGAGVCFGGLVRSVAVCLA
jgi:hypothetical protein